MSAVLPPVWESGLVPEALMGDRGLKYDSAPLL